MARFLSARKGTSTGAFSLLMFFWGLDAAWAEPVTGESSTPPMSEEGAPVTSSLGAFASVSWRGLAVARHLSHGPGFAAGVSFFDGWWRVGLAGFARPGPINPKSFRVEASGGRSYKGSEELRLKSDGGFFGLYSALAFDVPGLSWLSVVVPVTVGQAAFGFYLYGSDRDTPDGRRVSDWENELLDERDSSVCLGVDVGLQLGVRLAALPWIRPFLSAHYFWTPGYNAYVTNSYAGPSLSLGVELGRGL